MKTDLQNPCRSQLSFWRILYLPFAFMMLLQTPLWAIPQGHPAKQKPTLAEQVGKIAPGSRVEVRLFNRAKLLGRLDTVSATDFALLVQTRNGVVMRTLRFDDVKSVKEISLGKGLGRALLIAGAVGAVILLLSV